MSTVVSRSPEETRRLGKELGKTLHAGDVVLLEGDLGAGKTTFVKGIADACGVTVEVRSPTFALMHRYRGKPDVIHVDLYREKTAASLDDLALDEAGEKAILVVEWPKDLAAAAWPRAKVVRFEHVDETTRRITS
ncbi:MAG: tRNA (adenosine(37)-N6)-threonylcarbamoyltransferase complex ATPase subunit type 1 TsaE [Planctomycetes bacterium]|nr:tRNA (adenosine(37)-N6)-threonylcarbamoyltransferase complex ATPase subunit type 1 TsaE [Planctomycetota bacterium]